MSDLNRKLRQLRESASPRISGPEMAEMLKFESRQAYHHYEKETGFKGRFLPVDLARRIAAILADRGVNPDEVLALAGFEPGESVGTALSSDEGQLLSDFRSMSPDQRRAFLVLSASTARANAEDRVHTLHERKTDYRAAERDR